MKILFAYDQFVPAQLIKKVLTEELSGLGELEFDSFQVRPEDTPDNIPDTVDSLTFGSPQDLIDRINGVDVLVVHRAPVIQQVVDGANRLKVIASLRTSPGNVDVEAATRKKIPVVFARGRNAMGVAEMTFGLILAIARKIIYADSWIRAGNWSKGGLDHMGLFEGFELEGKCIGVVGFGAIGNLVARKAKGFGINVMVHDPYVKKDAIQRSGHEPVDLNTLLKESDIVSLHVKLPPGPAKEYLLGDRELGLMKNSSILINTSDGPVLDQNALYKALKHGIIAGAAQDGWIEYKVTPDNPLLELKNLIVTPGIGNATREVPERSIRMAGQDIARILKGEKPKFVANPEGLSF